MVKQTTKYITKKTLKYYSHTKAEEDLRDVIATSSFFAVA